MELSEKLVFYILNNPPQVWWPEHCVENTHGSNFHPNLKEIKHIIYNGCKGVNLSFYDSNKALKEMKEKGANIIKSDDLN